MEQRRDEGTVEDLCKYRIEIAKNDLKSAKLLFDNEDFRGANNRAYYAIFHAISAVHALDGHAYKKHKDSIANFNKNYVKTEIFDRSLGRKISDAEEVRHASDYDDFYIATIKDAKKQIDDAEEIIIAVEAYCDGRICKQ
ncbi:MAG: HEPN domain-containing protein [Pseudobutyrivibrio sp.]|nr:HEPN domain-containing protein [Pseudobutyrivibrio sp.]